MPISTGLFIILAVLIYVASYLTHGKYLERRIVEASPDKITPAHRLYDGVDYTPTSKLILYGHHFASIAGAGPIVGPAIALAWGWLPTLLWIWFGNIFIGVVHDYLSLMASVRHEGRSISWIAGQLLGRKASYIFNLYVWFALILVIAAFIAVTAAFFTGVPGSGLAAIVLILFALLVGTVMYRTRLGVAGGTVLAVVAVIASVALGYMFGDVFGHFMTSIAASIGITTRQLWMLILAIYCIIAASLPVWLLLQPRDFTNVLILWASLIIGGAAAVVAWHPAEIPAITSFMPRIIHGVPTPFWPCIPLIVACGALSGFHSLVASGTTSKQLSNELDALLVAYGGMLSEGFLATMVVATMAAFVPMAMLMIAPPATKSLIRQMLANPQLFADKYAYLLKTLGKWKVIPLSYALTVHEAFGLNIKAMTIFATIWITGFALTSLDTAARLARFSWHELMLGLRSPKIRNALSNKWLASLIAVLLGLLLAWNGSFLILWPSFSGMNQLLASLALMVISAWIYRICRSTGARLLVVVPAIFLWITVTSALVWYEAYVVPSIVASGGMGVITGVIVGIILGVSLALNLVLMALFVKSRVEK